MRPEKLTIKKRGQVTIPKHVRDLLGLQEEDQLELIVEEGKIILQPLITIAKDQSWFWKPEWQAGEKEAEEDIENGRVTSFDDADAALDFLHRHRD